MRRAPFATSSTSIVTAPVVVRTPPTASPEDENTDEVPPAPTSRDASKSPVLEEEMHVIDAASLYESVSYPFHTI